MQAPPPSSHSHHPHLQHPYPHHPNPLQSRPPPPAPPSSLPSAPLPSAPIGRNSPVSILQHIHDRYMRIPDVHAWLTTPDADADFHFATQETAVLVETGPSTPRKILSTSFPNTRTDLPFPASNDLLFLNHTSKSNFALGHVWGDISADTHPFSPLAMRMHPHQWRHVRSRKFASDLSVIGAVETVEFTWYRDGSCTVSVTRSPFAPAFTRLTAISLHLFYKPDDKPHQQLHEPAVAFFTYDHSTCTKCATQLCSCPDAVAPSHVDRSECFIMQAKRPDSTPVEAHYLAKSWVDRQRLVSRGSKKGEYTIVMNPFAVQRNSIRQEYFSNFRDNSAISERIQHHLTQLLSTLPNETYILPPTGYGDALVDCSDEKKGCRPSACDASSRDVISPSASANVSVNGAGICISAGAGSSSVVTAGGLGLDTLPNQGAASEKPQDTQDGNNNTKQRFSGTLPSSSLTSVGQDMNWPLNGRREETPTPKVHSLSPDPVVMLGTGPTGGADSRVLQTSGRGEVSTSTVTVAASSTCGPEKQGQDCDCSAETMPNRNLAYLLNSKHVRLELDEIPPYTPTPASFQQTMTQDDCGSITDRNQLAEKCTGGVCGGGTCVDLSTKKEKELEINVSGHLDSNSRSESPAGASVGSTAAPGSTAANVHSPIRRAPTLLGEPQAKRPRTDPSLKIDQVGTAYAAGWSGPSGSEPKDRGMQYPSWNLASLPERPLSALGRALGGTVRSPTPADNQSNVQKDNAPPKIPFTHGLGSSTDIARVKAGGSREVDYHQTPFELAPALKGSNNVGMNMSVEESMRNDASNGARLGQQMSKQHSMMGKIEERKDDSVSGNVGSARGAPIVEGSTSDAVESRVESDGNMDMNKDLKMNVNVNMSVNVNLNSHDSSKSMEHPACHGGNGEGGSSGVCAKRSSGLQCDICGITFAKRGNKMRHIATVHDRLKQFQCDYCGMKFGLKADLTRHRVRIHESRAFSCTKCSKSFAEESQLVMHVRVTHEENTKPWECATCHIRFGRKSSLTRHEQTVHQQTRFACSICKKTYSQRFDAIRHARKVHGVVNADKNGCLVLHQ